jgi:hypothetical protein
MRILGLACGLVALAAACGGTTAATNDAGTNDDGGGALEAATPDDASAAPDGPIPYPAPHTAMPLVDYNGGRIIVNPNIVTVTFASDDATMVSRVQQFDDIITTTAWWTAVSSEYCEQPGNSPCIGQGTAGGHVVMTDPPASSYTDSSTSGAPSTIKDFIRAQIIAGQTSSDAGTNDGGSEGFPQPDANTLYVIYFPAGVSVSLDGDTSCGTFLAYHDTFSMVDENNVDVAVPYAIIPRCGTKESTTTDSASHEIIEATTDPDIGIGSLAYYMLNQTWAGEGGGEVGDLCTSKTTTESSFTVQRIWSNKSAAAGEDPCVPIPSTEIYFNAAPRQAQIALQKKGDTATVDIDAYSDAPFPPWTISAVDVASEGQAQNSGLLSFSFDKTSVQNGDHAVLTVTATAAIPNDGDELFVSSKDTAGDRHNWPVLVVTKE